VLSAVGEGRAVALPAGSYVASGVVYFGNAVGVPQCTLWHRLPNGAAGKGWYGVPAAPYALPVADAFTAEEPTAVFVTCSGGAANTAVDPHVVITKVDTLHP
jgi:hypothetical protein